MGTEWLTVPQRTRVAVPLLLSICLCGGHFSLLAGLCDRLRRGIWIWFGVLSSGGLLNTPPRTTWFHHSPRSYAWQRAQPGGLSKQQGGLWHRSFGHPRAPALQELPLILSTYYSHGRVPCGSPAAAAKRLL